jgi:invasion protein IalB
MNKVFLSIIMLSIAGAMSATVVSAQTAEFTSGQWRTFSTQEAGNKTCYIASIPVKEVGTFKKRGEPFAMVTSRGKTDEVSISSGYPYKQATDVALTIDGKIINMFAKEDRAWAKDAATDQILVATMMNGTNMSVKGFSRLGSNSTDSYSLSGFTASYRKMKELCK